MALQLCQFCKVEQVKRRKHRTCSPSCGASLRWMEAPEPTNDARLAACNNGRRTWMAKRLAAEFRQWAVMFNIPITHAMLKAYTNARTKGYLVGYAAFYQQRRSSMIKATLHEDTAHTNTAREDGPRRTEVGRSVRG